MQYKIVYRTEMKSTWPGTRVTPTEIKIQERDIWPRAVKSNI